MRLTHSVVGIVTVVALLLIPLGPLSGTQSVAQAQTPDPPGRVGRISYMTGQVSFAPSGVDGWAPAVLNYPLSTGTALWTDTQARAELHIGSTAVRMDEYTELDILNLDDQAVQLRVPQGTVEVSLVQLTAGDRFEVATPAASVALVQPGRYRFQVDDSGLRLTVRAGQAEVATSSYAFVVPAVQTVLIVDSSSGGGYQVIRTPQLDEFGSWCLARDREDARALQLASQYAPPMMTGVGDLAVYGTWRTVQGYGWSWFPRVHSNWAPYRDGRWVWVSPWGWTWIDNARWGFAPFHYGRWVLIGGLWAWIPGPIHVRPVFAPALVVFLVIGGTVGWFPLAPQEVFVPAYPVSPRYFQTINVTVINITIYNIRTVNVTNINYVYRHNRKAGTFVPRDGFVGAKPVGSGWVPRPVEREFSRARVYAASPVQPDLGSVLGRSKQRAATPTPPRDVERRFVVVRATPPAVTPPKIVGGELSRRFTPVKPAVAKRPNGAAPPASQPGISTPSPAQQPGTPTPGPGQQPGVTTPRAPQQPGFAPSRPAPQPPATAPAPQGPQQNRPTPAVPGNPNKPFSCNPRSPIYDPQRCPPQAPQQHPGQPPAQPGAPQPRTMQPAAPPQPAQPGTPQPAQPGTPQPGFGGPRPAPQPPQVSPAPQSPQNHANPSAPGTPVKPFSCDPRSPIYDPQRCPPQAPQQRPGQPAAPQPRTMQPAVPPQPAQPVIPKPAQPGPPQPGFGAPRPAPQPPQVSPAPQGPQNHANQNAAKGKQDKKVSCDPRSPDYDPRQCPPPAPKH